MHVRLCFLDFSLIPKDVLFCSRVSFSVSKSHHQCFSFCKKTGVGVTLEYHLWPPDGRRSLDVVRKQRKHPGPAGLPQIVPHGATWNPPRCQHPSWTTVAVGSPPLAEFWQPAQVVQQARGAGFWTLCLFILFEFWLKSSSVGPVCPNSLSCAPYHWALASGGFCGWALLRGSASLWVDEKVWKLYRVSYLSLQRDLSPFPGSTLEQNWPVSCVCCMEQIALHLIQADCLEFNGACLPFGWRGLLGHGWFCRWFISVLTEWCVCWVLSRYCYSLRFTVCDVDGACSASGRGHVLHRGWNTRRVNPCISTGPWLHCDFSYSPGQWVFSCCRAFNIHNVPSSRPGATLMTLQLTLVLLPFPPNPF